MCTYDANESVAIMEYTASVLISRIIDRQHRIIITYQGISYIDADPLCFWRQAEPFQIAVAHSVKDSTMFCVLSFMSQHALNDSACTFDDFNSGIIVDICMAATGDDQRSCACAAHTNSHTICFDINSLHIPTGADDSRCA